MADLMYNGDRIKSQKSSPLLVSLHHLVDESKDKPDEAMPSGELLRELKANVRFLGYLTSEGKTK
jgi:hypothetical protein